MKIFFHVLIISCAMLLDAGGQTIYPCKAHTENGDPIEYQLEWEISLTGENFYILFSNDKKPFKEEILYMLIDRVSNESYIPYDSKAFHIDSSLTWIAHNYNLTEPGEYLIYFVNSVQKRMAEQKITVKYKDVSSPLASETSDTYYDNCQILFCEKVISGAAYRTLDEIYLHNGSATIYVLINNFKPLRSKTLSLNIWRKEFDEFLFDEFIESKKFKIDPLWNHTFFKLIFNRVGEYKLAVSNENNILIKYNFLKVF